LVSVRYTNLDMVNKIAILSGDGIGPEVMAEALKVLDTVSKKYDLTFETIEALIGGAAFDKVGNHFPDETKKICEQSDAILFGSVGGPVSTLHLDKWKNCEINSILGLRKAFDFNCNYRPIKIFNSLSEFCPLKKSLIDKGIDILFIRELVGDIYFGEKKRFEKDGIRHASDVASYDENQISSVAKLAFEAARKRKNKVTSVDKANVLAIGKLWREIVLEVSKDYQDVELEHILVDNCAMQLIKNPSQFDVILAPNMFGDILSDAAAVLPGSLGVMASASMNSEGFGLFEPPGGSAQDIAGKGIANPIGQILSLAMMLRFSFGLDKQAEVIEKAAEQTIDKGIRTGDIGGKSSTGEVGDAVCSFLV